MTAKVEEHAIKMKATQIVVDESERACINCIWYEQYYRRNRGNVAAWVGTNKGYCLLKSCERGALRQPCERYETAKTLQRSQREKK